MTTDTRYEVYQCEPAGASGNYQNALAIGDAMLDEGQRLFVRDTVTGAVYDATDQPRHPATPQSLRVDEPREGERWNHLLYGTVVVVEEGRSLGFMDAVTVLRQDGVRMLADRDSLTGKLS